MFLWIIPLEQVGWCMQLFSGFSCFKHNDLSVGDLDICLMFFPRWQVKTDTSGMWVLFTLITNEKNTFLKV